MATRATYQFTAQPESHRPSVCFYVHHDGYPEGAAQKFLAACTYQNEAGGLAESFMRANDRAEFTGSHASHGDTEYRYTITGEQLTVEARSEFGDRWSTGFFGNLIDFIQAKTGTKLIKHHGRYMTKETAGQHIAEIMDRAANALNRGWTGNAGSMVSNAWGLRNEYLIAFGHDEVLERADGCIASADRILAKGWEAQYGENAYAEWRKAFRPGPAAAIAAE